MDLRRRLAESADGDYRAFQLRLVPGIPPETVVGVRTPGLRALARELCGTAEGEAFLREVPDIAPTYYSLGNHEIRLASRETYLQAVAETRVTLLDNRVLRLREDIALGGLTSTRRTTPEEARALVASLAREEGYRLLMSHHPEDYFRLIRGHGIDLTLSGHAHGGQIQVFGRGLYAPGQGLLPKWTDGFYDDNHLLVSRGLTNSNPVPRWGNPCELILLTLLPKRIA